MWAHRGGVREGTGGKCADEGWECGRSGITQDRKVQWRARDVCRLGIARSYYFDSDCTEKCTIGSLLEPDVSGATVTAAGHRSAASSVNLNLTQ